MSKKKAKAAKLEPPMPPEPQALNESKDHPAAIEASLPASGAKGVVVGAAPNSVSNPDAPLDSDDHESMLAYQSLMRHRKQRKRKRIIGIAIAAFLALVALGIFVTGRMQNYNDSPAYAMQTYPVIRDDFSESVTAQGTLQPISQVVVTPEIDGIIETVNVSEGSTVQEGDVLLTIKNDDLDKAVNEAALNVRSAENGIQSAKNALNAAYVEESQGNGGGVPDAKIALDQAYLALETANEAYEQALANAEKRTIRAAESGSVVVMNAVVGQGVGQTPGAETGKLIQIANLSQMTVSVQVNELDISKIEVGQKAQASFSALPDLTLDAEVTRIATVAGSNDEYGGNYGVVSYTVDLLIPNPDPHLKPGMTATVDIMMQHLDNVLQVPISAIQEDGAGEPCVYVVLDPDTYKSEPRAIELLAQSSTTAAIEGDIEEGELVELMNFDMGDGALDDDSYSEIAY